MAIYRQGWWAAWEWVRMRHMDQLNIPECPTWSDMAQVQRDCEAEYSRGWNAFFEYDAQLSTYPA